MINKTCRNQNDENPSTYQRKGNEDRKEWSPIGAPHGPFHTVHSSKLGRIVPSFPCQRLEWHPTCEGLQLRHNQQCTRACRSSPVKECQKCEDCIQDFATKKEIFQSTTPYLHMTHGSKVVDFVRSCARNDGDKVGGIAKITIVQKQLDTSLVTIFVNVFNTTSIEARRTTNDTVDLVDDLRSHR